MTIICIYVRVLSHTQYSLKNVSRHMKFLTIIKQTFRILLFVEFFGCSVSMLVKPIKKPDRDVSRGRSQT